MSYADGTPLLDGLAKNVAFTLLPWTKITGVWLATQLPPPNPPSGAFDGLKPPANWLLGPSKITPWVAADSGAPGTAVSVPSAQPPAISTTIIQDRYRGGSIGAPSSCVARRTRSHHEWAAR